MTIKSAQQARKESEVDSGIMLEFIKNTVIPEQICRNPIKRHGVISDVYITKISKTHLNQLKQELKDLGYKVRYYWLFNILTFSW